MIERVAIRNYRLFETFDVAFSPGVNILVGSNDTGKSTLLEAIGIALSGRLHGRPLAFELSPYLVNANATKKYIDSLRTATPLTPPEIIIEIFMRSDESTAVLRGSNNLHHEDACGVRIQATLASDYLDEYEAFIQEPESVRLAPTEYYRVEWLNFAGGPVMMRNLPTSASVVDAASVRPQSGVDQHLQNILRTELDDHERVELSRQYRSLREQFAERDSVRSINERLRGASNELTDRELSLAVDISQRYTWESSITAHLDDLPFQFVGRGEQHSVKTLLAIGRRADQSHVVLIEEPETHLSFASLRRLIARIETACADKQVVIATHNTYVLNKLGLHNLILMGLGGEPVHITDLDPGTVAYFKKLAGFDTLRLVLAEKAILVEGPSDELVVQRAYRDAHGRLPLDDGIDVISVGLSHKRFLDLAVPLRKRVWVVTDNDGHSVEVVKERFAEYLRNDFVTLHTGGDPSLPTLEPQIVACNDLAVLNEVLDESFTNTNEAMVAMLADKTETALKIFESPKSIVMPSYIDDVIRAP